jgi:alkyl sulfatase BDS1-like metallo-beta-lactamase superfamily hydrolase
MEHIRRILGWTPPAPVLQAGSHQDLHAHSNEFRQEVIQVVEGIYVAVGYGLANSIMLTSPEGTIIVDTMGNVEAATAVKQAFAPHKQGPTKAIIYTHNHTDHIFGAGVFADDPASTSIDVIAHHTTSAAIDKIISIIRPVITRRSMRQFGAFLQPQDHVNCGIGPFLETRPDTPLALLRPTKTFTDQLKLDIAGFSIVLEHAPGETDDHIFLWLPDHDVMICGDNFYRAFPNLYAIRGTAYRDVLQWVQSVDRIRGHHPTHLIPCHSRPLTGQDTIHQALTDYRDAIQYVHDQTVRGMNQGQTPDQLASSIKLPAHLAQSPYLQEFYGTVAWSVRSIFNGYLGWFSGNPTDLSPLPPDQQADRMCRLAGGIESLRHHAKVAAKEHDHQWLLTLTDHLLQLTPDDQEARELRIDALKALGAQQTSANGRNYYLTQALELEGFALPIEAQRPKDLVHSIPMLTLFRAMSVALDAPRALDIDQCIGFHFPDTDEHFTLHVRKGVAEIQPHFPDTPGITVTTPSTVWKELLAGLRNPVATFASGDIDVDGSTIELASLLKLFQAP